MKVLMLGWELPPNISGGLGTACEGLLQGLASLDRNDLDITFVLPGATGEEVSDPWTIFDASRKRRPLERGPFEGKCGSYYSDGAYGVLTGQVAQFADDIVNSLDSIGREFDVIHAHDWLAYPGAMALHSQCGKPLVVHVHSTEIDRSVTPNPKILAIEQAGLLAADRIIAVSEFTKKLLVSHYHIDALKIHVVHNGCTQFPRAKHEREAWNPPTISFLGRITYQKGPFSFIYAAKAVLRDFPNARFVMAGDGDLLESSKSLARKLGIDSHFQFPGFVERSIGRELLARSAIFVMPSVSEPFGIVALEAASQGAALVLSTQSGVSEVVTPAALVDPSDIRSIAGAICRLLSDQDAARRLAEYARDEVNQLTWASSAHRICEIYQNVTS